MVSAFDEKTLRIKFSPPPSLTQLSFLVPGRRCHRLHPPGGQEQHHGPRPRPQSPAQGAVSLFRVETPLNIYVLFQLIPPLIIETNEQGSSISIMQYNDVMNYL